MLGLPGLVTLAITALLALASGPAPGGLFSTAAARGLERIDSAPVTRSYLIGVWETHNIEFGRDVRVTWTVRGDGSLDYDFVVDGGAFRGSTGTWDVGEGILTERWNRPDGTSGMGRATVERIDDNTFRLTVIDNGADEYRGLVRVYRRLGPAQLSAVPMSGNR